MENETVELSVFRGVIQVETVQYAEEQTALALNGIDDKKKKAVKLGWR
jgi:hypothetical protein